MAAKKDTIRLLAEIIANTSAQRSMGLLGAAQEPWDALRSHDYLNLFGYSTVEEVEEALRRRLKVKTVDE